MENFFEYIRINPGFKKIELESLMLVEYQCPIEAEILPIWTPHDVLLYCLSGQKTWKTNDRSETVHKDQSLFITKGAQIVYQSFEEEFCLLMLFIKEGFKYRLKHEKVPPAPLDENAGSSFTIQPVHQSPVLQTYYQSILSLLTQANPPSYQLMELKLLELVHLLAHIPGNSSIIKYLLRTEDAPEERLREVMQNNYMYNLQLSDFAQLCNRSLSSFKRDFQKCYGSTPGTWLRERRMERAAHLLEHTADSITQVAFDCGFEDASHFSRVFRHFFGMPPLTYRNRES